MAMLTVAARLFRNRAHAEISTSQQVHAGCGQLVGGLAALALAIALLASRTSTSSAGTYAGQAVMQSFAGLNIPSSSAGPSPWARASSCRASASTRPGHSCSPAHLSLGIPFALTLPRPAHPRRRT